MAPLKKGTYCFATVGRLVGRSVGQSVGMSVGLSVCRPSLVRSIPFDPFTWSIPNLVQGLPSMSRWSLLIFRSHVQMSRSCYPVNIFWPLHLINTILGAGVALNEYMIPIDFQVTCSKVKVKPQGQYIWTPSLDQYQTWCRGCTQ